MFGLIFVNAQESAVIECGSRAEYDGNARASRDFATDLDKHFIRSTTKAITDATNSGSGLIRIKAVAHGFATSDVVAITNVGGVTAANGEWTITVVDANHFDLQGSTFSGTYAAATGKAGIRDELDHTLSSVRGLTLGQASVVIEMGADVSDYAEGEVVTQANTGARGVIVENGVGVTSITVRVQTIADFDDGSVIVGQTTGTSMTPSIAVPIYHRAPRSIRITGAPLKIHNVFANAILGNNGENSVIIESVILGDSVIDHWAYIDNNQQLVIENLGVFGYCRGGGIHLSSGCIGNIYDVDGGIADHPLRAVYPSELRVGDVVFVRGDNPERLDLTFRLASNFSLLDVSGERRNLVWVSGGSGISLGGGFVRHTGSPADTFTALNGTGLKGVSISGIEFRNAPVLRLVDSTQHIERLYVGPDVVISNNPLAPSTNGSLINVPANYDILDSWIGLKTLANGASTCSYKQLLTVGRNATGVVLEQLKLETTLNSGHLASVGNTVTACVVRDSRAKCANSNALGGLRAQGWVIDHLGYSLSMTSYSDWGYLRDRSFTYSQMTGGLTAANAGAGARTTITDSTASTFGATIAGGGANTVPAFSNGTNWIVG